MSYSVQLLNRIVKEQIHRIRRIQGNISCGDAALNPGGASRDRTGDLLLAKQALSQLSYGP